MRRLLLLALLAAACGEEPLLNAFPPPPVETDQVSVVDNAFEPANVIVNAGDVVTWTWAGADDHTVVFDAAGIPPSPVQSQGTHQVSFSLTGTYSYFCSIHGRSVMAGSVEVRPVGPEP